MTDFLFPPHARISAEQITAVTNAAAARSIFSGAVRTVARAGSRLRFGISTSNASTREDYRNDAALQSLLARLEGQTHRVWFTDPGYVRRGSFQAFELLTNNTFASGTADWLQQNPEFSVTDRVARLVRTQFTSTVDVLLRTAAVTGLTQYAPYVCRSFDLIGRGSWISGVQLGSTLGGEEYGRSTVSGGGMKTLAVVVPATSAHFGLVDYQTTPNSAGDYYEVPYTSMARCPLVDAGVNLLTRSEEFNDASWVKTAATVTANSTISPDGTVTADALVDTAVNTSHFLEKSFTVAAAASDFSFTVAVASSARTFACIEMRTATGAASVFIDLASGALSTLGASSSFSNARAFIQSRGGNYTQLCLVARKISSETSIAARIYSAANGSTTAYLGAGTAAIVLWRATLSGSGVAQRLKQTTNVASNGETQQGNALHLKGLPPSSAGLLLPGDRVQVGTQKNIVTAPLNSDALGLGYLECGFRWRASPSDNAPVIIHQPFGRFIQTGPETGWDQQPGGLSNYQLEIEEALDA